MEIQEIITITFAVIGAASIALKYIAPLTKNKVDDKIYAIIEEILKLASWDKDNKILRLFKDSEDELIIRINK